MNTKEWCWSSERDQESCDLSGGNALTLTPRTMCFHTTPEAVLAGATTADDWAGNDLAEACKLVVFEHRAPPNVRAARLSTNLAVTRMVH